MKNNTGILLIDKPSGITSHTVVNKVRRVTGVKRVGHAGTLDPLATGLLIVLVGREFTKQQSRFLKQDKTYICQAVLGTETDTYDSDGQVVNQAEWEKIRGITQSQLEQALTSFKGQIKQQVPAFSAVKVKGEKLYNRARQGTVKKEDLPIRDVRVHELKLIDFKKKTAEKQLLFTIEVSCSSGTYIRSLVHDIGQMLGVGATVTTLRRTKIGSYSIEQAITIEELQKLQK